MHHLVRPALAGLACALIAATSACGAASSSNPLIGKWRAASADCQGIPEIEFTPTSKIMHMGAVGPGMPASVNTEAVVYRMSGKAVATAPANGGGQMVVWEMPDANTMLYPNGCRYVRE